MKLLGDLYTVISETPSDEGRDFRLSFNPEHFIYKAHFPGEPVTPGVCILKIAVETLELAAGHSLRLECARNVKFLRVINPLLTTRATCCVKNASLDEDGRIRAHITLENDGEILAKLSLICVKH